MKQLSKLRAVAGSLTMALALLVGTGGSTAFAAAPVAPPLARAGGPQAKPPVAPGSRDAKQTAKLGPTKLVKVDKNGKPVVKSSGVTAFAGNVANVDFATPLNYCWKSLVYTPIVNNTSVVKYAQVQVYNQGGYRDFYVTIPANSSVYPTFYGVEGAYTAYMYVWNGSGYQYDEYRSSNNTCNVSVSRVYNTGGWVELKIQNLGTAYATQQSAELAPFPSYGTYTGTQYDYPVAGGAALYRWFWVGTSPYGIVSTTYGAGTLPWFFTGDL